MEAAYIVLVEDDIDRRRHVINLLHFVGYSDHVLALDRSDFGKFIANHNRSCIVILGASHSNGQEFGNCLRELDSRHVVIGIYSEGSIPDENVLSHCRAHHISLSIPLRYEEMLSVLRQASQHIRNIEVPKGCNTQALNAVVGMSESMSSVRTMAAQVADCDASVLLLGESGTGKEVVSRAIHSLSGRCDKPFVAINCGAIPEALLESELFGHEKGAFTGATCQRKGRFEMAEGGTLFLDEIGDMSPPMQVKLLRVLQERVYERVGGTKTLKTNVRIIAATHRNLEQRIQEGLFREDLYYRLNVFPIELPPLRERLEDIPDLIDVLGSRHIGAHTPVIFTRSAVEVLQQFNWPGNVRELGNLIERMHVLSTNGVIDVPQLPARYRGNIADQSEADALQVTYQLDSLVSADRNLPDNGIDLKSYLGDIEYSLIRQALNNCGGVIAQAAKLLQLRRTTLVEKLRKYGYYADLSERAAA